MAINLEKGQRINLEKGNGSKLQNICVGINWGAIEKKGLFGTKKEAVDLDGSCTVYDANKNAIDTVSFKKLMSSDQAIKHSGDDLTGDLNGDDGLDNEIITLDLARLNPNANYVAFYINSFRGQDFKDIPFASIRIFEGTPSRVQEVFAKYDVANDKNFAGSVSMVLGVFYKRNNEWKFNAIGEPTRDRNIEETVVTIQQNYL
ncbi:Tellurium resistance protein TerD [Flavobacterium branchiophilum NBRC 15030 = ATCC 35035]|uniref:TerZ/TerD family protein, possibly involved in tellurium resistance n=2 Tax=Flavobacterium branchiophilum TaxID=55197 RepID=G2Z398_FLABF|nr:TerD family protein [Flavobacterium branchiophilum]OXA76248.1 Tellurium resistance protein TerD [Flavobacterium branchiophilum NBRC 15030 = ATCC 35035]TQM40495.1 tellurium resistance protein TerZ [Flavobacterium branchiophilum]GEM56281.1 tellurium resistance protein TerZ [Flavobacterium branchiophilum NBRC 15030 = ATCC 35035]CCB68211.1 TerZ/TerD family protein, possibly involved in tellurium resistance [Flavobacterium branchiophilum FL-15]